MPPKQQQLRGTAVGRPARAGYARETFNALASPENRSVVTSITFFAVSRPNKYLRGGWALGWHMVAAQKDAHGVTTTQEAFTEIL